MNSIFRKDISEMKEFRKYGDTFKQVRHNPETGWYLYERTGEDGKRQYEVVRGKKYKNPGGEIVYSYPSTDFWGSHGYTVMDNRYAEKMIDFLMSAGSRTADEIYQFKKRLKYAPI